MCLAQGPQRSDAGEARTDGKNNHWSIQGKEIVNPHIGRRNIDYRKLIVTVITT